MGKKNEIIALPTYPSLISKKLHHPNKRKSIEFEVCIILILIPCIFPKRPYKLGLPKTLFATQLDWREYTHKMINQRIRFSLFLALALLPIHRHGRCMPTELFSFCVILTQGRLKSKVGGWLVVCDRILKLVLS